MTRKAILASVPFTTADVLLQGMPEAGLSLEKDFKVDEAFLQTKTKADLLTMTRALKIYDGLAKECKIIPVAVAKAKKGK